MSSKLISEVTERRCSKKRWTSFFLIHFVLFFLFSLFGDFFVDVQTFEKEEEKIFLCVVLKKVVLFCIKIIMLKRRRGQNASINPALEHIEVDADILRASLTCELCKNILREANTVVCFLY